MKLEVGKRYVLRNGIVTGPMKYTSGKNYPWSATANGIERQWCENGACFFGATSSFDIVFEYIEPQPQPEPLRWVENCKPDKPGIWAVRRSDGSAAICDWTEEEVKYQSTTNTRCYLGPIPEILPPRKKVVQRLWLEPTDVPAIMGCRTFIERWFADGASDTQINDWIRTDRTREVEQ